VKKRVTNYSSLIQILLPFLGVSKFFVQLFDYIRSRNASEEDVRFVENQIYNGRTRHTTSSSEERKGFEEFVRNSTYVMNYLVRMYYYDFLIFGYQLPNLELIPIASQ
jgi:hypothetical protein